MLHLKSPMEPLYDEVGLPRDERRSLDYILLANICGSTFGIVGQASTSAMVSLSTRLGANDFIFGLITAIFQISCIFQIPFSMLLRRTGKRKAYMLSFGIPGRFLWIPIGFLPLLFPGGQSMGLVLLLALLMIYAVVMAMPSIAWYSWYSDLAPVNIRSRWLSIKETFSAISGFLFGLLVACVLDSGLGDVKYVIVFTLTGLIGVADMVLFGFVKDVPLAKGPNQSFRSLLQAIFHNRGFMRFTWMWTVWCFTSNAFSPYLTPYSMNVMGLNSMQITLFGTMACSISTALAMPRWGRLLTRVKSGRVMIISCLLCCVTPFVYLFSAPGNIWPTLIYNIVGALAWSGCNLCAAQMQLEFSTPEIRPSYLAIFNSLTALVGTTLGSLGGGVFLDVALAHNWHIGFMDRYMILIVFGALLRLAGVLAFAPVLGDFSLHRAKTAR